MLYHGTNTIVKVPEVRVSGYYIDFGYGFYCTRLKRQAERWSITKRGRHIICCYEYIENPNLNTKIFTQMTDEWLDFVVDCRQGVTHQYDIVEGPMADDQIWDYVEDYSNGIISREAFWALARFKHPTHQIVFCSELAIKTLTYKSYYTI